LPYAELILFLQISAAALEIQLSLASPNAIVGSK
jgi:hypothetical protein